MRENDGSMVQERRAIEERIWKLAEGWNRHDEALFGSPFAPDADYTVWNGMYSKRRTAIADGHQRIFDTLYAGTTLMIKVRSIRFLRDDVAIAHLEGRIARADGTLASDYPTCPMMVLTKGEAGEWQITPSKTRPSCREPHGATPIPHNLRPLRPNSEPLGTFGVGAPPELFEPLGGEETLRATRRPDFVTREDDRLLERRVRVVGAKVACEEGNMTPVENRRLEEENDHICV